MKKQRTNRRTQILELNLQRNGASSSKAHEASHNMCSENRPQKKRENGPREERVSFRRTQRAMAFHMDALVSLSQAEITPALAQRYQPIKIFRGGDVKLDLVHGTTYATFLKELVLKEELALLEGLEPSLNRLSLLAKRLGLCLDLYLDYLRSKVKYLAKVNKLLFDRMMLIVSVDVSELLLELLKWERGLGRFILVSKILERKYDFFGKVQRKDDLSAKVQTFYGRLRDCIQDLDAVKAPLDQLRDEIKPVLDGLRQDAPEWTMKRVNKHLSSLKP